MKLIRCDKCGKEIRQERGNKVTIEHNTILMINRTFEVDLCTDCTKEIEKKIIERRKKADSEEEM